MTVDDVTRTKGWAPGSPAEVLYRPDLTKPDPRAVELRELRRLLRTALDRLAPADDLLARAARNITTAEQHHPADCQTCAREAAA